MARSLRGLDENSAAAANLYLDNTIAAWNHTKVWVSSF
jgi:hypothetical protein